MSEIVIDPCSESRHFYLCQHHIFNYAIYNNGYFLEYNSGNTPTTPTASYFPNGYCINSKHTNGWYNVNIKQILGNLYDKYEKFYLCINSIYHLQATTTLPLDRTNLKLYSIRINGLPFENIINNKKSIFTSYKANQNANTSTLISPSLQFFKFTKVPTANIEIQLFFLNENGEVQVDGNYMFYGSSLLANQGYGLSIYPCIED